jgi:hypothetical protein
LHSSLLKNLYLVAASAIVVAGLIFATKNFRNEDREKKKYVLTVLLLFCFTVLTFTFLYSQSPNIDYSTRHFKLTSFLIYPIVLDTLLRQMNKKFLFLGVGILVIIAAGNHLRLCRTWLSGTSVTASGFRLSKQDMPLPLKNRLDSLVKTRTIVVSPYESRYAIDNDLIWPVQSADTALPGLIGLGYPVLNYCPGQ